MTRAMKAYRLQIFKGTGYQNQILSGVKNSEYYLNLRNNSRKRLVMEYLRGHSDGQSKKQE